MKDHRKCPFCGAEPEFVKQMDYDYTPANEAMIGFIRCSNYLCWAKTKECIIQVFDNDWNEPVQPPVPDEEVWKLWDRRAE